MVPFKQNNEITYDDKELMEENSFIGSDVEEEEIPAFDTIRSELPQPIWNDHIDYINCYWKAWEIAFSNIRKPQMDTGFVTNYIDAAFNNCIFIC